LKTTNYQLNFCPMQRPCAQEVPTAHSSTKLARREPATRQGNILGAILTTRPVESRKITVMGYDIQNVCTELQRGISSACPRAASSGLRKSKPRPRSIKLSQTNISAVSRVLSRSKLCCRIQLLQIFHKRKRNWESNNNKSNWKNKNN
jgi:hypothetical protein